MTALVSIVLPVFNARQYLQDAVQSIIDQTYEDWQLIIVDDASNDGSRELIEQLCQSNAAIEAIYNDNNTGVSSSRNRALKKVRGQFVAFIDSDDRWMPDKLRLQLQRMQEHDCSVCYTGYYRCDDLGDIYSEIEALPITAYDDLLRGAAVGMSTLIYDVHKLGLCFFEQIKHEDFDMKLSLLDRSGYACGVQQPLVIYRVHQDSLSANKLKAALWRWRVLKKHEPKMVRRLFYFSCYVWNSICVRLFK